MHPAPNTPIIVATAQKTWRDTDATRTPVDALHDVASQALAQVDIDNLSRHIDAIATVRFIADTDPNVAALFPRNPGHMLAQRLGIKDATCYQTGIGGNTPQFLVNHFADRLASGETQAVLICGVELLASLFAALGNGDDISGWLGQDCGQPLTIGEDKDGLNEVEKRHGLYEPINTYPLFENALQHHLGKNSTDHHQHIAQLCSSMSAVAANNPHAWKQAYQSPEDIATVSKKNRYIGYPYTKAMNPVLAVDMAAAVVMTTVGKAQELGIDPSQWVYLRGTADVNDIWHITERENLYQSPAIRMAAQAVMAQSGLTVDALSHFDIYSCFPSAVEIACREIGLSPLDPRGITVTGGLPYFGGPGNNYSLHAIAQMVATLRDKGHGHGLVTANGLYLTKHSMALYSTEKPDHRWQPIDSSALQAKIEADNRRRAAADPAGPATLESFTVTYDRNGPAKGIIIALNQNGERIIANTENNAAIFERLTSQDMIGCDGRVRCNDGQNLFEF
jgi:acetyl-CoA C-acetyltransferase